MIRDLNRLRNNSGPFGTGDTNVSVVFYLSASEFSKNLQVKNVIPQNKATLVKKERPL